MDKGCDYSSARPGGAALKAAGFAFAVRYLAEDRRGLTTAEAADLHANGIAIPLVYESRATRALGGWQAGVDDGAYALSLARRLGVPDDRPIYFAVDFDASEAQQAPINDYLRGCASVMGAERVGVYGGFWVVKRCAENGSAHWFWQTYAWSGGRQYPGNHIYQYKNGEWGGSIDLDEAYGDDYGQWPKPEEASMTPEQVKAICEEFVSQTFPAYLEAYFDGGFTARNGQNGAPMPRRFWDEDPPVIGATEDVREIIKEALQRAADGV